MPVQIGVFIVLTIELNAAGTSASFYINGTLVGTITTNIPTASNRLTGNMAKIEKGGAGTTARFLYIDAFQLGHFH